MRAALGGRKTDRAPFFPCIYIDHACRALGHTFEEALVDPRLGVRWMVEAGMFYGCDAVRVRFTPERSWFEEKEVRFEGDRLVQVDRRTGRIDGHLDVEGGGQLIPAVPPDPVRAVEQIGAIGFPSADQLLENGCLETARELTDEAHRRDLFVVGMATGQTINALVLRMGDPGEALERMATDPPFIHRMFQMATDASIELIRAYARVGVDCVVIGDSYASGSVISPGMYAEFCLPAYRRAADAARAAGLFVYKHCCGNYNPLLQLIERVSIDGMEGIDPTSGMSVARTRAALGERLCLIGGVSCMSLLRASPDEVHAEARECIRAGGADGRYVLGSACAVPRAAPVDNLRALARAAMG